VCGSMEAVFESVNLSRELRAEPFFSKSWKDVQSMIAEYGLQGIMCPRHVEVFYFREAASSAAALGVEYIVQHTTAPMGRSQLHPMPGVCLLAMVKE